MSTMSRNIRTLGVVATARQGRLACARLGRDSGSLLFQRGSQETSGKKHFKAKALGQVQPAVFDQDQESQYGQDPVE